MATCFGLLRAEPSGDSMRVGLSIDEEVLSVTGVDGSTWDIGLDRVYFDQWAQGELRLELAGEPVSFMPEDSDAVVTHIVPALIVNRRADARALTVSSWTPAAPAQQRPSDLTIDLTEPPESPKQRPPVPASAVAKTDQPEVAATPAAPKRLRTAVPRLLIAAALLVAIALAAFGLSQLGRSTSEKAQDVLADAGFESILVSVQGDTATLSGSVETPQEADAARAAVAGVDGIETVVSELVVSEIEPSTEPVAAAPEPDPSESITADAGRALVIAGLEGASLQLEDGQAVVSGEVASEAVRRAATAALLGVEGVDRIDNRLSVTSVEDAAIEAAAREALDGAGFELLGLAVNAGVVTVSGVAPQDVLIDGFFRFSDEVENTILAVEGVSGISNRLQIKGDEATLRRELKGLTETSPVIFAIGRSELTSTSRTALDAAAEIIQAQPGLRVLIAGHADTTGSIAFNEELSRARAAAVRGYLIERGVAANRVLIVAYGELFPSAPGGDRAEDRRVEFEVAA